MSDADRNALDKELQEKILALQVSLNYFLIRLLEKSEKHKAIREETRDDFWLYKKVLFQGTASRIIRRGLWFRGGGRIRWRWGRGRREGGRDWGRERWCFWNDLDNSCNRNRPARNYVSAWLCFNCLDCPNLQESKPCVSVTWTLDRRLQT